MAAENYLFTSESVSEGHPDKICDIISDAVLDSHLRTNEQARVACECLATTNTVIVAGEIGSAAPPAHDGGIEGIVRDVVRELDYEQDRFHWQQLKVVDLLNPQSPEIAKGVDQGGAGDQGLMFGYACDETKELMPAPIHYSHAILRNISESRKSGRIPRSDIGPDGKVQLTVEYQDHQPQRIRTIVLSHQHSDSVDPQQGVRGLLEPLVREVVPDGWLDDATWWVNPSEKFVEGGPATDAGLTGRKIIVDTYGGAAPHGGGAFSGKDPTKVDRSAAYAVRYVAKNVVAAGLARRCTIQVSYAIGREDPTSLMVNTHGTGTTASDEQLAECIRQEVDLTPNGIRQTLGLSQPIYQRTAAYGHFGRAPEADGGFSWERLDLVDPLRARLG